MTYNYTDISLTEFPGEISLVLYSGSCLCHCPWCFNPELLKYKPLSYKQMKDAIDEHLDFITAVVFSGGDPVLNPFLIKAIKYCKSKGLKIKINTNGLVDESNYKNIFLPYVDYINISIKGLYREYDKVLKKTKVSSIIPHCNMLEYSFVFCPTIHTEKYINDFKIFLKDKISYDWSTMFSNRWSQPDIFTISQMEVGECLNNDFNSYKSPDRLACINIAQIFRFIAKKKLIIETKEFGREIV